MDAAALRDDYRSLYHAEWRPTPFREFVLKMHSRCDLACDYCYMFTLAGSSVSPATRVMTPATVAKSAERLAEHVEQHGLTDVRVVFHGGEPLLAGVPALAAAAARIRSTLTPDVNVDIVVQTNGVRLDAGTLRGLDEARIRVGVSVDGGRAANDRHRVRANGESSFDRVHGALELLAAHPASFAGILAVIDLANEPVQTFRDLVAFRPPALDFLLPHGNWSSRPPGRARDESTPYGDWLAAVFDHWFDGRRRQPRIRLFEEIIRLLLGHPGRSEMIGLTPVGVIVINVDGAMEQIDTLRSAYSGAVDTGLSIATDSFDEALRHPAVIARQVGLAALSPVCLSCPVHQICGGGYYPHRFDSVTGFRNPSVFCADLRRLIEHVADRVRPEFASGRGSR